MLAGESHLRRLVRKILTAEHGLDVERHPVRVVSHVFGHFDTGVYAQSIEQVLLSTIKNIENKILQKLKRRLTNVVSEVLMTSNSPDKISADKLHSAHIPHNARVRAQLVGSCVASAADAARKTGSVRINVFDVAEMGFVQI